MMLTVFICGFYSHLKSDFIMKNSLLYFSVFVFLGLEVEAQDLIFYHATGYSDPMYSYDESKKRLTIDFWVKNDGFDDSDATEIAAVVINKDKDDEETVVDSYDMPGLSYSPNAGENLHHVVEWTVSLGNEGLDDGEYKLKIHMNPDKSAFEHDYENNAMTFGSSFDFAAGSDNSVGIYDVQKDNDLVTIFPNPASGAVNIEMELQEKSNIEVRLYDVSGKLLKVEGRMGAAPGGKTIQVPLDGIKPGVYFCTVGLDNSIISNKKVLVSR